MRMSKVGGVVCLLAAFCILTPTPSRAETIGAPVVARGAVDSAAGSIFALNIGFTSASSVVSWSFYNDNATQLGYYLTPLLLDVVGGNYIITGVGTARANSSTGVQTFAFGLTSGSDAVGPGTLFGWKDGLVATSTQTGVIQFDFTPSPVAGTQQWFLGGHSGDLLPGTSLGAGSLLGAGIGQPDRDYSVQAATVPEPVSMALLGAGLVVLGLVGRRKYSA